MESSKQLSQRLQRFRESRSTGSEYYDRARKGLGVSDDRTERLRGALQGVQQSYMSVDPSVTGRTQGSLVSEAQRRGMVAQERAPIAELYRTTSDALSTEIGQQQALKGEARSRAGHLYSKDETIQSSIQKQYKKTLASEQAAAKRRQEREKFERMLSQSRQLLSQQRRLADLSRESDERIAMYDRLARYGY